MQRSSRAFHRRLVGAVFLAVAALAAVSVVLAWRQYDSSKTRDLTDLEARVVAVSALANVAFQGQITSLEVVAKSPVVAAGKAAAMSSYFRRLQSAKSPLFSGSIAWLDLAGELKASSMSVAAVNVSQRTYFRKVRATGAPYVSAGLTSVRLHRQVVVVAVPTRNRAGRVNGVLTGSLLLSTLRENREALQLGYGGLNILDRNGHLLLSTLVPTTNTALVKRVWSESTGIVPATAGLNGQRDDAVAFARAAIPDWVIVIAQPRSTLFAAATRALLLELASLGAVVLLVGVVLVVLVRRSRRSTAIYDRRARSWGGLTRALASATTQPEVANALLESLAEAFAGAIGVVTVDANARVGAGAHGQTLRTLVERCEELGAISELGLHGPVTVLLERDPRFRGLYVLSGRRLRALRALPIIDRDGRELGTISLLCPTDAFEESEWALLRSFADQAALAIERAARFEHEHDLASQLQRSLLPDRLPHAAGIELAGHYHAGGHAVEIGGDWYDAVRRPDGIVQLCVGDVSGRGIGPATVMGRQRNTFHVCAYDTVSPAEIIRRLLRQAEGDEMITVACLSLDPYTGELVYACAGHPPPLLLDRDTSEIVRLDRASAPPVGVAEPADIVEAKLMLPAHAALALYTDGLIERRGVNIDHGIDLLGRVLACQTAISPDGVLRRIRDLLGAPDDDVALLLLNFDAERTIFELEMPARADSLPTLRQRLRRWLARRGLEEFEAADVVLAVTEACNNAIEHAYRTGEGTISVAVHDEWETLEITVEDHGSWRERDDSNDERGRGLVLMRQLMHSAEVDGGAKGTRVTLRRQVRLEPDGETQPLRSVTGA